MKSSGSGPVRVVVVEDSLVQRAFLVRTLEAEGDIQVVGQAEGAVEAAALVERLRPEVVTVDIHIPDGGGAHAIEQIMGNVPTPILVLSASVENRQSVAAVEALVAGALDALPKPRRWTAEHQALVRSRVRALRDVTVVRHPRGRLRQSRTSCDEDHVQSAPRACASRVVGIAASTGGPPALASVLGGLDGLDAPILVVQHLHPDFVDGLVQWMARVTRLDVQVATNREPARPGVVYIGPGDVHLRLDADLRISLAPHPVCAHRPSADELLQSIAIHAGPSGIGVVLTGMGSDGAAGLLALRRAGGSTLAQDRESCAVYGMPRRSLELGAVDRTIPLAGIPRAILRAAAEVPV